MLKRVFVTNLLIMLIANVLVKPVWVFGIDRVVQLRVGHDAYGLYTALLGLTVVFNILLDVGITSYNNREIAKDSTRIHSSLPNLIVAKVMLACMYAFILSLVATLLGYGKQSIGLFALLIVSQVISSFVLFLRSNISANHDFKMDAWLSVMDKVLMIIMCSLILYSDQFSITMGVTQFVIIQIIAYSATAFAALLFIIKKYTHLQWSYISWKEVKAHCLQSLPYAALIFLMGIYMRGDAVMLERMAGSRETGFFAGGYRLLDISNTLGVLTAGILLSMFSRFIHLPNKIVGLLEVSVQMILPLSITICIFSVFRSNEIIHLLYHETGGQIPKVFSLLMLSFPAYCLLYIYSTLLTAKGEIKLLILFAGIGSILSLVLNILLIPRWGAQGTALVSLVVHWLLTICSMVAVFLFYPNSFNKGLWFRLAIFILIMTGLNMFLNHIQLCLELVVLLNGIVWMALILLLGIFNKKKISAFFLPG